MLLANTGVFTDKIKEWSCLPIDNKTWTWFNINFHRTHWYTRKQAKTAKQEGFNYANKNVFGIGDSTTMHNILLVPKHQTLP